MLEESLATAAQTMAYDFAAGPSTPDRGFGLARRPSNSLANPQQQRTPSFGPGSNSSAFGQSFGLPRSSSMRSIPTAQSSTGPAFGFGGMKDGYSTPKSVRWEDAPSTPIQEPATSSSMFRPSVPSQQSFNFGQTSMMTTQQQQQQLHSHPQHRQQIDPMRTSQSQPYQLTQPTAQSQTSSSLSPHPTAFHQRSLASSSKEMVSASTSTTVQAPSVFHRSASQATQATAQAQKPSALTNRSPQAPKAAAESAQSTLAVVVSRPAQLSRIKWNLMAVMVTWLGPRFSAAGRMYWILLDVAFSIFGGDADVHVATMLSWLRSALTVILAINIIEATILLNTATASPSSDSAGTSLPATKRKPSLAYPPNRVLPAAASSSPTTKTTTTLRKTSTPRQYAQNSPLKESILRASASAHGLGEGRRLPSQTPKFEKGARKSSNASPLAAFLARKHDRLASGSANMGDLSFDGDADLSTDSIEVDRALRAFSADYDREVSQNRSLDSGEGLKTAIAV